MLNYLWGMMIMIGVIYGAANGTMEEVGEAALAAAREAVSLCITMLGVMGLWLGMMEVGRASGLLECLTAKLRPALRFLFPNIPKDHKALEAIGINLISNMLGLGWAATPAGLKAMEELEKLEEERRDAALGGISMAHRSQKKHGLFHGRELRAMPPGTASDEMCTFLVLNISSLQLIPVNIIAYRQQYGSMNPAGIIAPSILATAVSTGVAVAYCKWKGQRK